MSGPATSQDIDGFRAGLARGELMLPSCTACDTVLAYSARVCTVCRSPEIGWRRASGRAKLRCVVEISVSYTQRLRAPFLIASVQLEEGPHLLAPCDKDMESADGGQAIIAHFDRGGLCFRRAPE